MANYFVIDNTFRPYSFDELVKPYQMYGEAYRQQEALLDAAREKEFSPDALDQVQDKAAYDMYNNAASGLKAASDELATRGLSAELRSRIRTTARDYKTTMENLNNAQQRLLAEQDRRAKLGPDYIYQQEGLRIGDFLNGKTPNQRGESLSTISNDIATEFSRRSKAITKDTWSKAMDSNGKVVGGYYDVTTESGLTAAQLDTILSDEKTWSNIMADNRLTNEEKRNLSRFREDIVAKKNAVGYSDFTPDNQARIDDAIIRGATAGLGASTHEYKKDEGYNPLGWANYNLSAQKYRDALAAEEDPYEHEAGKPVSRESRTGNLKPGYIWVNGQPVHDGTFTGNKGGGSGSSSSRSGSGSGNQNDRIPFIGVMHFDESGKAKGYAGDTEWNKDGKKSGTAVTRAAQLSNRNKEILAVQVGMNPDDSAEAIYEEALRRGISVSVIDHGNKPEKQEMILRGTKTFIGDGQQQQQGEFDEDG